MEYEKSCVIAVVFGAPEAVTAFPGAELILRKAFLS